MRKGSSTKGSSQPLTISIDQCHSKDPQYRCNSNQATKEEVLFIYNTGFRKHKYNKRGYLIRCNILEWKEESFSSEGEFDQADIAMDGSNRNSSPVIVSAYSLVYGAILNTVA